MSSTFTLPIEKYERLRRCVEICIQLNEQNWGTFLKKCQKENIDKNISSMFGSEYSDNEEAYLDLLLLLDDAVTEEFKKEIGIS